MRHDGRLRLPYGRETETCLYELGAKQRSRCNRAKTILQIPVGHILKLIVWQREKFAKANPDLRKSKGIKAPSRNPTLATDLHSV